MIRTAAEILADLHAQDAEPDPYAEPVESQHRDEPRRPRSVVDIDLAAGRLLVGYDDIRRHAKVWIGVQPPPQEPQPSPLRKGCPSEGQYRRHLAAGEKCAPCREHVNRLERSRRAKWGRR